MCKARLVGSRGHRPCVRNIVEYQGRLWKVESFGKMLLHGGIVWKIVKHCGTTSVRERTTSWGLVGIQNNTTRLVGLLSNIVRYCRVL